MLIISLVGPVLNESFLINVVISALNQIFGLEVHMQEVHVADYILLVVIIVIFSRFSLKIYNNWDSSKISERQHKNEPSSIQLDFFMQLQDFLTKKKIIIHQGEDDSVKETVFQKVNMKVNPWYIELSELLTLTSKQYRINIELDYHPDRATTISKYGQNGKYIAILSTKFEPKRNAMNSFIDFIESQNKEFEKIIIGVEVGDSEDIIDEVKGCSVEIIYKENLVNNLINFTNYYDFIFDQFENNNLFSSGNISLADTYVSSSGTKLDETDIKSVENEIIRWSSVETHKHIAVLGEYGQGKSTLSLKICYELCKNEERSRIPILIELRGQSPRNLSMLELLAAWSVKFSYDANALFKLHKLGKLILIFEGFDEMDLVGDWEMRANHFSSLWEFAKFPNAKIIITGRPNFFLDDDEQNIALGIESRSKSLPYCQPIYLKNFSKEQIILSLRQFDQKTMDSIISVLESPLQTTFKDLISRPSTLFLTASIWNEEFSNIDNNQINSALVIQKFIKASYERQVGKINVTPLLVNERDYFMLGIALKMFQRNEYSNQIYKDDLKQIIIDLYEGFPDDISRLNANLEKPRKPLKKRISCDDRIAFESILTDIRSCGILVKDVSRNDYFRFAHKSFFEYLISFYVYTDSFSMLEHDQLKINCIKKVLGINASLNCSVQINRFVAQLINHSLLNDKRFNYCSGSGNFKYSPVLVLKLITGNRLWYIKLNTFVASNRQMFKLLNYFFLCSTFYLKGKGAEFLNIGESGNTTYTIIFWIFILLQTVFFMRISGGAYSLKNKLIVWKLSCEEAGFDEKDIKHLIHPRYMRILNQVEKDKLNHTGRR